ncbi:MAG: caspase family protein [Magnetococcales bacterium]|nr:caspase family protein [Magnetococcales bacterium]
MFAKWFRLWSIAILLLTTLVLAGCETPMPLLEEPTAPAPGVNQQHSSQVVKSKAPVKVIKQTKHIPLPIKLAPTTQPILTIDPGFHISQINKIAVDATGDLLATASFDKTLRLWDAKSGELRRTIRMPTDLYDDGELYSVALSPDGRTAAVGGRIGAAWDKSFSIYLFDTVTGYMTRRILGLGNIVSDLAFSADGSHMAAVMLGGKGLLVFSMPDGNLIKSDGEYGENDSYSVDFAKDGRLLTTGWDGYIRIYDKQFNLVVKKAAWGGSKPHIARFSPDGLEIAVGFNDSSHVNILSGIDLTYRHSPESSGVENGNLNSVSWSANGNFLFAGGTWDKNGTWPIRSWSLRGRGKYQDSYMVKGEITDIRPRPYGGIYFASAQPALGVLNSYGKTTFLNQPAIADLSNNISGLTISDNGTQIQFGLLNRGNRPAMFSMSHRELILDPLEDFNMSPPRTSSRNIHVTDWQNTDYPSINNHRLPLKENETSHSLAVTPDGNRFLLGTKWNLYLFDSYGKKIWQKNTPGAVLGVNVSGNGRIGIAAFANGTIRWFFMNDGRDVATLFPHKDGKRWVLWTPEGFFTQAKDGAKLIGYHINQGADKAAKFLPFSSLYHPFYRPDLIAAKYVGNHKAVEKALAKVDINQILQAGLPPKIGFTSHKTGNNLLEKYVDLKIQLFNQGGGFGRLLYKLNGVTVSADKIAEGLQGQNTLNLTKTITLQPGKNSIAVTAFNKENKIASSPVNLELLVEEGKTIQPSLYLLAVGISKYKDAALQLSYSVQNAKLIAREINTGGQLQYENVVVETLFDEEATTTGIKQAFAQLSQQMKNNDVFFLYLAGHSLILDGNYHFIPQELIFKNEDTVRNDGLDNYELQSLLASIPAFQGLIIVDTCNSSGQSALGLSEKTAVDRLTRSTGRKILTSSTKNQAAIEGDRYRNIFTQSMLEALRSPCL